MHLAKGTRLLLLGLLMMALAATGAHRGGEVSDLGREMLTAHNAVRTALHLSPLSWSDRLAASAQSWADALVESGEFCHTPHLLHGQNLFEIRGGIVTPTRVVNAWASESLDYDYRSNRCRSVCGHYMQIIWRFTSEVGCAVSHRGEREVWACEYDPPGNV